MGIIGISAHGNQALSAKFIKFGADDFIHKPFQQEEFLCRINHVVNNLELNLHLENLNQQKNQLLGIAAHDIRGPVGNIQTCLKLLKKYDNSTDSSAKQKLMQMISNNTDGVLNLLNDLLSSSAIESGQCSINLQPEYFTPLVEETLDFCKLASQQKQQTIIVNNNSTKQCSLDKHRIRECLDNLVSNAIKYSPLDSTIVIDCFEDNGYQVCTVSDQGPGIPADQQDRLFKPFAKLDPQPTGGESSTGLGLFICDSIARSHGGKLSYQSISAGGSEFRLALPFT